MLELDGFAKVLKQGFTVGTSRARHDHVAGLGSECGVLVVVVVESEGKVLPCR
jgi:hypothetical protein